ncbi:MAG: sulfatase, partial [Verrucomicrobiota bacterium]
DRLAEEGSLFDRSYCQIPLCGPSRVSLMTGQYPEKLNVYGNNLPWRKDNPDVVTLSQYFKNNGYTAVAAGKIYHNGESHQDDASWSDPNLKHWRNSLMDDYRNPDSLATLREAEKNAQANGENTHMASLPYILPYEKQLVEDEETTDGKIAQVGIDYLREFKESGEPFFLALGFHKPHLSFNAPAKYWDMYDRDELPGAPNPDVPEDYYQWYYKSFYIREFKGLPKEGPIPDEMIKTLRHAYFAAVSFVDAQIGKVLDELRLLDLDENTIVVLWGDHGYLLDDHGVFGKHNQFEQSMRAPLIIASPTISQAKHVRGPAEFVDIYPTVCELAGLPIPDQVQGVSQVEALQSGKSKRQAAYSIFGSPQQVLSRSIRTPRYRYIEWDRRGEILHRVLFDYEADPLETQNFFDDPEYQTRVGALQEALELRKEMAED